jgi:hypothetical protein
MAAIRPESDSAEVTPTEVDAGAVSPAAVVADPTPAAPDSVPAPPVVDSPAASVATGPVEPVAVAPAEPVALAPAALAPAAPTPVVAATAPHQVVYVEAPKPFIAKGNRGFGILIALLSTVIFAALYAVAQLVAELINHVSPLDFGFITTLDFYAPVLMFAVGFVVLVIIVNRAGWAAHVLGSIFVGLVVFFGGTGVILLLHINQIPSNQVGTAFSQVLFSTGSIVAALLGREVALWMGFAIASRGRRVRARNADARVLYDREIAAKRAEYEQANARNATGAVEPVVAAPVVAPVASEPVVAETGPVEPVVAEPVATETTAP